MKIICYNIKNSSNFNNMINNKASIIVKPHAVRLNVLMRKHGKCFSVL